MLWAIISDIHGNREALEAVLRSIDGIKADKIICLGDIVGYGADPNGCVELIKQHSDAVIMGNHDHAAVGLTSTVFFNIYAKEAIEWTSLNLTESNKQFLLNLPFTHVLDNAFFVHSSPHKPENWGYILSSWEAEWNYDYFEEDICFVGHSHVPVEYKNEQNSKKIVNSGSVGQPRDNDPRSCYYLFDTAKRKGKWVRVEYPVAAAAQKIIEAGLPKILAERLYMGR